MLGIWYLMTAGHCITEIEKARRKGYDAKFLLLDSLGPQKKFRQPIRIDNGDYAYIDIDIDHSADYAAIHLHDFTRRLEATGIRALDRRVWQLQPARVEDFGLVGIPDELLERRERSIGTTTKFYSVEPPRTRRASTGASRSPLHKRIHGSTRWPSGTFVRS